MHDQMMQELDAMASAMSGMGFVERQLDLCFLLDTTGSMGSYITSARENIQLICNEIINSGRMGSRECLRVGLIAYRDHPPQEHSFVTNDFAFTSNIGQIEEALAVCRASGGGDGPEAVIAAMKAAMDLQWRPAASKMCILITDAPPHGTGEYGDGFRDGDPTGLDPLQLGRDMATRGISLFVVACEPGLSGYANATDFYKAMTQITCATMVPLTTADLLPHVIVGSAFEQMDMERLIQEVGQAVAKRIHDDNQSVEDVAKELHEKLMLRNESTKHLVVEDIYRDSEEARHHVQVWLNAGSCQEAIPQLKRVIGSRFTDKYQASRHRSSSMAAGAWPMSSYIVGSPSRASPSKSPPSYGVSPYLVAGFGSPPSSPSRHTNTVNNFKAYTGSPTFSGRVSFDSPVSPVLSPQNPPFPDSQANAPSENNVSSTLPRPPTESQRVDLKEGSISLEQAKRITTSAAWRTLRM